ncbi:MAG: hypothetical protein IT320_10570 [Anaerolineae bacterium]|nr:hypothetical protein [Anaerolineae bacterium]
MKDLPRFRHRNPDEVHDLVAHILTNKVDTRSTLRRLVERDDHSFRAIFDPRYFVLADGEPTPTKSQWNNLKKKLKRTAPDIFVFKDHGQDECEPGTPGCYYVDFGFFLEREQPLAADRGRPQRGFRDSTAGNKRDDWRGRDDRTRPGPSPRTRRGRGG